MRVRDVMSLTAESIAPDTSAIEAAARMKVLNVKCLPVCDNRKFEGLITDRAIVIHLISQRRDPLCTKVREIMTVGPTYCFDDQSVDEAAALMEGLKTDFMAILNRSQNLVGMLSLDDVTNPADTIYLDRANDILKNFRRLRPLK